MLKHLGAASGARSEQCLHTAPPPFDIVCIDQGIYSACKKWKQQRNVEGKTVDSCINSRIADKHAHTYMHRLRLTRLCARCRSLTHMRIYLPPVPARAVLLLSSNITVIRCFFFKQFFLLTVRANLCETDVSKCV